jgi:hypothetical protein
MRENMWAKSLCVAAAVASSVCGGGKGGVMLHCNEKQRSNRLFYGLLLGDFIHIAAELAIHMLCYIYSILTGFAYANCRC